MHAHKCFMAVPVNFYIDSTFFITYSQVILSSVVIVQQCKNSAKTAWLVYMEGNSVPGRNVIVVVLKQKTVCADLINITRHICRVHINVKFIHVLEAESCRPYWY